jgi:GDP-L-fucose synthase
MLSKDYKIFISGHKGMVGSAIVRKFKEKGYNNLILRSRHELDLRDKIAVKSFFAAESPDIVILAAAKVGGILNNLKHRAEFLIENLEIQNNVIGAAFEAQVKKFCFLGSSCIYPCQCPQPIKEEYLLSGPFEPTNEGYAIAKVAGYKLCQYYAEQYGFNTISLMPCNLYGTNDHYDLNDSHVLAAFIRKFADAADDNLNEVTVWGTGIARREFLHVNDLADAVYFLTQNWNSPEFVNIGAGYDISIKELAIKIANAAGFNGKIIWDSTKPDGMLKKCMDISKLKNIGFTPKVSLDEGIAKTIAEYREMKKSGTIRL